MENMYYEILVEQHIKRNATEFGSLKLTRLIDGNTMLCGVVRDQSELNAILRKLGDMNLVIIKVERRGEK